MGHSLDICVCVYIYIYACICVCGMSVCSCVHVCACVCACVDVHACVVCTHVHACVQSPCVFVSMPPVDPQGPVVTDNGNLIIDWKFIPKKVIYVVDRRYLVLKE